MSPSPQKNKVTLVHGGIKGGYVHIPLGILTLAEALLRHGFAPRLVDLRVMDLTPADVEGALFLGVSHMTGSMQIPPALASARLARTAGVPVVFGGAHPSILLEETATHPLVDVAVKGEGEETVVELAEYFQGRREIGSIGGIAFKDAAGRVVATGPRQPPLYDRVAHLPYDLLPMERYLGTGADFGYQSSRGCPHRCAFCAEVSLFPKTWRPKSARVVVEEIEAIVARFHPKRIFFVDSNFFCSKKRVKEFCQLVIKHGIKTKFFGECRFDYFHKYEPEFLELLKAAGFNEIEFGGESGSDTTLTRLMKDTTTEQILSGIAKCRQAGLKSFTSFMIGIPGESEAEMNETLAIYDRIMALDPRGTRINGMFIYSPFPGTRLFETVVREWGFQPPRGLDEWATYELYDSVNVTWFGPAKKKRLRTISILVRYFFVVKTLREWSFAEKVKRHGGLLKALASILFNYGLYPLARWRWRRRAFRHGLEMVLWQKVFHGFMGRK